MWSETELKNSLQKESPKSVYLLFGDDPYLVKHYSGLLVQKIVGENRDLNLVELPDSAGVNDIFAALNQLSFTGERLCVQATDFNFEGCPIKEFKALQQAIAEAPAQNTLLLSFEATPLNPKKSDRCKKLIALVEQTGGAVCQLNHKTGAQLTKMLCEGAARRGCSMRPEVAVFLIETCSNDLNILMNELEKLCAFVQSGEITKQTVQAVCPKTVDASIYDLAKHIAAGRGDKAICLLQELKQSGLSNIEILANLTDYYTDLFKAKAAAKAGLSADRAAKELGYPPNRAFVLKNAMHDAAKLPDAALSKILQQLLESDKIVKAESKLSTGSGTTQLEYLITRLMLLSRGSR